ncbi:uncharacterized protein LOC133789952 [Humulus lupulus]|uniref:uncharacterized protein LOC133789952 n=1 Tax=Humulus lupulus TaxID=3486 RepID=UPI002B40C737|nr:uncharacterized protein LOC133789952 [Humulus lupulus]
MARRCRGGTRLRPRQQCDCGLESVVRTSWTEANPGRRCRTCRLMKSEGGCDFFRWMDPEMAEGGRVVVPNWRKRIEGETWNTEDLLESEITSLNCGNKSIMGEGHVCSACGHLLKKDWIGISWGKLVFIVFVIVLVRCLKY